MEDPLVETWMIHNRINLYLLDAIAEDSLGLAVPKCRTIHDQFAHLHNVRLMWIKPAAPALLEGLETLATKQVGTKDQLRQALEASGHAIAALLRGAIASELFTFLDHADAPFDNNHAEREIRTAVIARKNSYANGSAEAPAVLMSVFHTLKQRGHNPVSAVVKAVRASLQTGQLPPLPAKVAEFG